MHTKHCIYLLQCLYINTDRFQCKSIVLLIVGDLFEGDIIPSEKMMKLIAKENRTALEKLKKSQSRDVLSYDSMHWKDKRIPYIFDSGLSMTFLC